MIKNISLTLVSGVVVLTMNVLQPSALCAPIPVTTFYVHQNNALCDKEGTACQLRRIKAQQALQKFSQMPLDLHHVPLIAMAGSGGGCRAAIALLGMLKG